MRALACQILLASLVFVAVVLDVRPVSAQTLRFCAQAAPHGFDPARYTTSATFDASSRIIYDRLVAFDPGSTRLRPGLAESWRFSTDRRSVTFQLRKDVQFHSNEHFEPTRTFNADDVIFSFARQAKPDHPHYANPDGLWPYYTGMSLPQVIKDIEKIDDHTVTFHLSHPDVSFIATLAMDFASILSQEYADAMLAAGTHGNIDLFPIGTGPFSLFSYHDARRIRFARFEPHWGAPAGVDDLIFVIDRSSSGRVQKLLDGVCHVTAVSNQDMMNALDDNTNIDVIAQPSLDISYLAYNTQQPPFDNVRVRKALNMAINTQRLTNEVFEGFGMVAVRPLSPLIDVPGSTRIDHQFDPTTAQNILISEGVVDLSMNLWVMPEPRRFNPHPMRMAELIREDLAAIGVEVNLMSYGWAEFLDRTRDVHRNGAVLLGWTGDNGHPDNILSPLLSCHSVGHHNRAQWCHPEFEDLITKARQQPNPQLRQTLYEEALDIFHREAPWVSIATTRNFAATRRGVENFRLHPLGGHDFRSVTLSDPVTQ